MRRGQKAMKQQIAKAKLLKGVAENNSHYDQLQLQCVAAALGSAWPIRQV